MRLVLLLVVCHVLLSHLDAPESHYKSAENRSKAAPEQNFDIRAVADIRRVLGSSAVDVGAGVGAKSSIDDFGCVL